MMKKRMFRFNRFFFTPISMSNRTDQDVLFIVIRLDHTEQFEQCQKNFQGKPLDETLTFRSE